MKSLQYLAIDLLQIIQQAVQPKEVGWLQYFTFWAPHCLTLPSIIENLVKKKEKNQKNQENVDFFKCRRLHYCQAPKSSNKSLCPVQFHTHGPRPLILAQLRASSPYLGCARAPMATAPSLGRDNLLVLILQVFFFLSAHAPVQIFNTQQY